MEMDDTRPNVWPPLVHEHFVHRHSLLLRLLVHPPSQWTAPPCRNRRGLFRVKNARSSSERSPLESECAASTVPRTPAAPETVTKRAPGKPLGDPFKSGPR